MQVSGVTCFRLHQRLAEGYFVRRADLEVILLIWTQAVFVVGHEALMGNLEPKSILA